MLGDVMSAGWVLAMRRVTIEPGGSTGWHYHDHDVRGYVCHGTLTCYSAACSVGGVYRTGETILERGGTDNVHLALNLGPGAVGLFIVQVMRDGAPFSVAQAGPACWLG